MREVASGGSVVDPRIIEGLLSVHSHSDHLPLDELTPRMKKPLLAACAATVATDRQVSIEEAELLRVIADTLGCPVPPLLPGQKAA